MRIGHVSQVCIGCSHCLRRWVLCLGVVKQQGRLCSQGSTADACGRGRRCRARCLGSRVRSRCSRLQNRRSLGLGVGAQRREERSAGCGCGGVSPAGAENGDDRPRLRNCFSRGARRERVFCRQRVRGGRQGIAACRWAHCRGHVGGAQRRHWVDGARTGRRFFHRHHSSLAPSDHFFIRIRHYIPLLIVGDNGLGGDRARMNRDLRGGRGGDPASARRHDGIVICRGDRGRRGLGTARSSTVRITVARSCGCSEGGSSTSISGHRRDLCDLSCKRFPALGP